MLASGMCSLEDVSAQLIAMILLKNEINDCICNNIDVTFSDTVQFFCITKAHSRWV